MRIGVIGADGLGGTLARHFAELGLHFSSVDSRAPESLTGLDSEIGATPAPLETGALKGTTWRIALAVGGDSLAAKAVVFRLVDDLGFDPIEGGELDDSWWQQPGTPASCRDRAADALRRELAQPDRSRIAKYRAGVKARTRRSIAAQTAERSS